MKSYVHGLIRKPTLFFTNNGVSFFADSHERWFVSEVLDRIVDAETKQVYSTVLFDDDGSSDFTLRRIELTVRLEEIDRRGTDRIQEKTLVYER